MVAKVFVVLLLLFAMLLAVYWLTLKYALPHYRELMEEYQKTQRKQLERDEKLVEEAEREYRERR